MLFDMAPRFYILLKMFEKTRVDWRKSKSPIARELQGLMDSTDVIAPEHLWEPQGIPLTDTQAVRYLETIEAENKI